MGSTKKDLVDDLRRKPYSLKREYILRRALKGKYHDFDSDLATPKVQLAHDLRAAGFDDLAERVIDGAYDDEKPTQDQIEELRAEFGPEAFDQLFGRKGRGDG